MTDVYRMFDGEGRLLYVGVTGQLLQRLTLHGYEKPWWGDVATVTLTHYDDASAARAVERQAIENELPLHNIVSLGRPGPGSKPGFTPAQYGERHGRGESVEALAADAGCPVPVMASVLRVSVPYLMGWEDEPSDKAAA